MTRNKSSRARRVNEVLLYIRNKVLHIYTALKMDTQIQNIKSVMYLRIRKDAFNISSSIKNGPCINSLWHTFRAAIIIKENRK